MDQANKIDYNIRVIIYMLRITCGDLNKLDDERKADLQQAINGLNELSLMPYFDKLPENQFQAKCMLEKITNSRNDIKKVHDTVCKYGYELGIIIQDPNYINISSSLGALECILQREIKDLEKIAKQQTPEVDNELLNMFRGNNAEEQKYNFECFRTEYNVITANNTTTKRPLKTIIKAFVKYMNPKYEFGNSSRDSSILANYGILIDRRYLSKDYIEQNNLL